MDKEQLLKQVAFRQNNGKVLRTINILRKNYNKLEVVAEALEIERISEAEFCDSINYLDLSGYIHLRDVLTKQDVVFADCEYKDLEAKLTSKGISLLAGAHTDELVEI